MPSFMRKSRITSPYGLAAVGGVVALLLFIILSYSNALQGEFQFDDDLHISGARDIRSPMEYLEKIWTLKVLSSGIRPLTMFTFSINYALGGLSVEGYHAVNIFLHVCVIVLLGILLRNIYGRLHEDQTPGKGLLMLFASLGIFALHPIQTQAVTYIVQRGEVLASLFYVGALLLMIRFLELRGGKSLGYWFMAMVCFFLGWASKEIIVTMPVMFFLYAVYFMDRGAVKKAALGIAPMLIAGLVLGIRVVAGFQGSEHVGFGIEGLGPAEYFFTELRVLVTYLRLLVLPAGQNLDYDYPVFREFLDVNVILSFVFWVSVTVMSLYSLRVKGRWRMHVRVMGFGMLWFLIVLSPTSTFIPLVDVINEHRLYLPMLGIVMSAAAGVDMVLVRAREKYGRLPSPWTGAVLVLVLLTVLGVATYERNTVWRTKLSLWQDAVSKSPRKARPHNNLGQTLLMKGMYREAEGQLLKAIEIDPDHVSSYNNLGLAYQGLNDLEKAEQAFVLAIRKNERFIDARINLGIVYARKGEFDRAIEEFRKTKELAPSHPGIPNNMGIVYAQMGKTEAAERYFLEAVRLDPAYAEAYANLGNLYGSQGRTDDAIRYFRKALSLDPANTVLRYRLTLSYIEAGRWNEADHEYQILRTKDAFLAAELRKRMTGIR